MRIAVVHKAVLPVKAYGGTERIVWWLAKGLHEAGHDVVLGALPGTECSFASVHAIDFSRPFEPQLPKVDLIHLFFTPSESLETPFIVTIEGNGKPGEVFSKNTIFISRNHAERHGSKCFVYNGLDPSDYVYRESKNRNLLFLAKASWSVKNVRGAIRVARAAGRRLEIVGGTTWFFNPWRGVHWNGYLGGINKAEIVASSEALLFPVLWDEPFGISVIEALVSGTPVLGSPFGSLPELIHPDVGFICKSEDEFVSAIDGLKPNQSKKCRDWVLSKFTYTQMVESYLKHYETVLQGQELNEKAPVASVATNAYQIPRLVGGVRALGLRHRYRAEAGRS